MRTSSVRGSFLTGTAILGAIVWGLVEFLALQWSGLTFRFRPRNPLGPA
jgi:hypothetical protein